jgi:hypothetical protein
LRSRVLHLALSTLLAVPAALLSSSSAQAAESDVSFSNIVVNNGRPIVAGINREMEVPVSYVIKHSVELKWHQVYVYRGALIGPDENLVGMWMGPECRASASGTVESCRITLLLDPRRDLRNGDVGVWKTGGIADIVDGTFDADTNPVTTVVKRSSRLTVNASPEPVVRGKAITVTGRITRANWNTHTFAGYADRKVKLQFRAQGSDTWATVKTVTSGARGGVKATVTAQADGYWRWVYSGSSTTGACRSVVDFVDVQ